MDRLSEQVVANLTVEPGERQGWISVRLTGGPPEPFSAIITADRNGIADDACSYRRNRLQRHCPEGKLDPADAARALALVALRVDPEAAREALAESEEATDGTPE